MDSKLSHRCFRIYFHKRYLDIVHLNNHLVDSLLVGNHLAVDIHSVVDNVLVVDSFLVVDIVLDNYFDLDILDDQDNFRCLLDQGSRNLLNLDNLHRRHYILVGKFVASALFDQEVVDINLRLVVVAEYYNYNLDLIECVYEYRTDYRWKLKKLNKINSFYCYQNN